MYLHIGEDILVHTDEIVAILDKKLLNSSSILAEFLQQKENITLHVAKKSIKSIVVTTEQVYYSPLSSMTLKKRAQQYVMIADE